MECVENPYKSRVVSVEQVWNKCGISMEKEKSLPDGQTCDIAERAQAIPLQTLYHNKTKTKIRGRRNEKSTDNSRRNRKPIRLSVG